jgi:hypothetical protein
MLRRAFLASPLTPLLANTGAVTRAGFAETDVTPAFGMEQPGGYGKVYHRTFHDACKARASVFDDGRKAVAIVGIDALVAPRIVVDNARRAIATRTGLAPEAILVGASHSHSSGPVGMVLPGEYDFADPFIRKLAYEQSSGADPKYLDQLTKGIVDAVVTAWSSRRALKLGAGVGREDRAAFNRRHRMKNGITYTHPRQGNPDMLDYAGPIDPEVGVVGAWDDQGRLAGCLVNYSCHATTSPGGISANWIYYLEKTIRGAMDAPDAVVVFLQGCSGDITQVDNKSPYAAPSGDEQARLVGGRVGAESVKVLLSMARGTLTPVDFAVDNVRIARRAPSPERVAKAMEVAKQDPKIAGPANWTFAKELVLADALVRHEPVVNAEFQAVQLGPVLFASNPGETFVEIGLAIKRQSKFKMTFPVELANGCVGYVATEEALGPRGGGYETRLTSYTNLEPKAAATFIATATKLSQRFTPGALPEPPSAPKFSGPWDYGNVPAEVK